ncbi:MAG: glycosyltransferase family 4 protein [Bacteroidales bacterium]
MKRVLIITYYWPPSGGAGVQRWLKFVKYLPGFGWEPIIIAPDPDRATYPAMDQSLKNEVGKNTRVIHTEGDGSFRLYKKFFGKKQLPSAGFANNTEKNSFMDKFSRFIRGNFFIPDPRKGWNKHAEKAAKEIIHDTGVDIIITTGPPHSTHLIGLTLSSQFGIPWLADFRDPWTDIYYYRDFYPTPPAHRLNVRLEKKVISNANHIVTVSRGLKNILVEKNWCSAEKITVIHNGFDKDDFLNIPEPDRERFTITYVGTLSDAYPIDSFIQAITELLESGTDLELRFIGSVSRNQRNKLGAIPNNHIIYVPYVDHDKAIEYMGLSNLLLLILPEHTSTQGILTGKLFEYLASKRPILGIGPHDCDAAVILSECDAGVMAGYSDETQMRSFISESINSHTPRNEKLSKPCQRFSRKKLTQQLTEILYTMIDQSQTGNN